MIEEDLILIQNVLNGNLTAQETLYNKYKKIIKNYIKNKYSKHNDIDDDVSEILIKIFLNLNTFDSEKSKFYTWVCNIAKNHIINNWRNQPAFTLSINNSGTSATNNSSVDWTNTTTSNASPFNTNYSCTCTNNTDFENCNTISYLSTQISPVDYCLLNMKYIHGYNYCEIGQEFNVTSSTISNRINYIKAKLKKNNPKLIYD